MLRAGIDIGTNTILLLIADVSGDRVETIQDHVRIVRLGQGVDKSKAFHPDALIRADACFKEYQAILAGFPGIEVRAAATSGSRDAKNSSQYFQQVREQFGIDVKVISGPEEARLSFEGAFAGQAVDQDSMAVLDIGGGSSELVTKQNGSLVKHSFDMGCVRMAERYLHHDPAFADEIVALRGFAKKALSTSPQLWDALRGKSLVGVAGTVTYLASCALGLDRFDPLRIHGTSVSAKQVGEQIAKLSPLTAKERLGLGGMDAGRADVIVAGALLLEEILLQGGFASLKVSVQGLRYGLVL